MSEKTIRVLLVEDNELNRDMLIRRLDRAGVDVLPAVTRLAIPAADWMYRRV